MDKLLIGFVSMFTAVCVIEARYAENSEAAEAWLLCANAGADTVVALLGKRLDS